MHTYHQPAIVVIPSHLPHGGRVCATRVRRIAFLCHVHRSPAQAQPPLRHPVATHTCRTMDPFTFYYNFFPLWLIGLISTFFRLSIYLLRLLFVSDSSSRLFLSGSCRLICIGEEGRMNRLLSSVSCVCRCPRAENARTLMLMAMFCFVSSSRTCYIPTSID